MSYLFILIGRGLVEKYILSGCYLVTIFVERRGGWDI